MAGSKGTGAAAPAVISRRDAIIGALALAAGSLVAARPETARAATGDPVILGAMHYADEATSIDLTSDGTDSGIFRASVWLDWTHPMNGTVRAVVGQVWEDAPPDSAGVEGYAALAGQVGVMASNAATDGVALSVYGKASFSRSGKSMIYKGSSYRTVTGLSGIGSDAIILATLQGPAGTGNHVRYVKRVSSTSFRVYFTKVATANAYFGWMILN